MKSKLKGKLFGNTDLLYEEDEIQYELSAMLHLSKEKFGEYTFPSLSFWKNKGMKTEELIEVWDNEEYLYNKLFLNVLKPFVAGMHYNKKEFGYLKEFDYFEESHIKGLYKLFEKAVLLGFFEGVK
jgi:hypothetical protein